MFVSEYVHATIVGSVLGQFFFKASLSVSRSHKKRQTIFVLKEYLDTTLSDFIGGEAQVQRG